MPDDAQDTTNDPDDPRRERGAAARQRQFLAQRMAGGPRRRRAGTRVLPPDRRALLQEFRGQQAAQQAGGAWVPLGPAVLRRGQADTQPPVAGRTPGIAITPDGARVYVATANGGVWVSTDVGATWTSLMDAWDLDPRTRASDSLACGAIAVVPGPPDRIYVGSGEGDGTFWGSAGGDGLGYFGVGPIVSSDGGTTWVTEPVAPGSAPLAGSAFFALAVDPADPERVVAGTEQGLYRREPDGTGAHHWVEQAVAGSAPVTSVVASSGTSGTTFYAAASGGPVWSSADGATWTEIGSDFPEVADRIGLTVTSDGDRTVLYALVAAPDLHLRGLYRLDRPDWPWREVIGLPATVFGADLHKTGQGGYDLAVAVEPGNPGRVYVGGSTVRGIDYSAALFRVDVVPGKGVVRAVVTHVGGSVHPDVHTLVFGQGAAEGLWVGCDGGVFHAPGEGPFDAWQFTARNTGLATLMMEHLGHHPTEEAVLFCGSQDNGGQRFTGSEAWELASTGDCGYMLVNWADPDKVLSTYIGERINRSLSGGGRGTFSAVDVPVEPGEATSFYGPIAGTPRRPEAPEEADLVAFGSERPWISTDFGDAWTSVPSGTLDGDRLHGLVRALAFASAHRLWVGTDRPSVHRLDRTDGSWTRTQVDAGELPTGMAVTDIAVDPADPSTGSIYVSLGGNGDPRHVWHFDGTDWTDRSAGLLDVHHNALVADPQRPGHLYAGADVGVWRSADGGSSWVPFSEGLPDVAVMDLALHSPSRLLRAATHGRGVYERDVDRPTPPAVLYIRNTVFDRGRGPAPTGLPDPATPGAVVTIDDGPDIRFGTFDDPAATPAPSDILRFDEVLGDAPDVPDGEQVGQAFVRVHNRGTTRADGVRVTLLAANAPVALPALSDADLDAVRAGEPIVAGPWRTLGTATLDGVHALGPRIATFVLDPRMLPPVPAGQLHAGLLAVVHHPDDPLTAAAGDARTASALDRHVAHRNVVSVRVGSEPAVVPLRLNNPGSGPLRARVTVRCGDWLGRVRLHLPVPPDEVDGATAEDDTLAAWADATHDPADVAWARERAVDVAAVQTVVDARPGEDLVVGGVRVGRGSPVTVFLELGPPAEAGVADPVLITVEQTDADAGVVLGTVIVQAGRDWFDGRGRGRDVR